jgi:hypothetical protein
MFGMFGLCVAMVLRVSILMLMDSKVIGPGTNDWLAFFLPHTLSGGAWCLVVCVVGSLFYLKGRIGAWLAALFVELLIVALSAAVTGIGSSVLLSIAADGEAARDIAALIALAMVMGILAADFAAITGIRDEADWEEARAKAATGLPREIPQNIILD